MDKRTILKTLDGSESGSTEKLGESGGNRKCVCGRIIPPGSHAWMHRVSTGSWPVNVNLCLICIVQLYMKTMQLHRKEVGEEVEKMIIESI